MFLSKLKVTTAGLLAALLVGGVLIPGLCALPQSSLAQQPAVKQQEEPPDKESAKKAPDVGKGGAKVVKADEFVKDGKLVESRACCNNGKTVAVVVWKQLPAANPNAQETAVVLWDLQQGKVKQTLEKFDEGNLRFHHLTASKDGLTIAAAAEEIGEVGTVAIKVWDAKTGKVRQTVTSGRSNPYPALSPDGKRVDGGQRQLGRDDAGLAHPGGTAQEVSPVTAWANRARQDRAATICVQEPSPRFGSCAAFAFASSFFLSSASFFNLVYSR